MCVRVDCPDDASVTANSPNTDHHRSPVTSIQQILVCPGRMSDCRAHDLSVIRAFCIFINKTERFVKNQACNYVIDVISNFPLFYFLHE